jgi:glycosyltransferase involved in cell wall biosynthesis
MKVLAGVPWRLDSDVTGLSTRLIQQFTATAKKGFETRLYSPGPSRTFNGFRNFHLSARVLQDEDPISPILNSVFFSDAFSRVVNRKEWDVLHCFNTTALFVEGESYLFQTVNPTYAFIKEMVNSEYPKTGKYLRKLAYYEFAASLEKKEYESAPMVVASSDLARENIARHYDVSRRLIHVIPAGVDPDICDLNYEKKESRLKIILFPNRVAVLKGFHYVAEAMKKIKKAFPNSLLVVTNRVDNFEYDMLSNDLKTLKEMRAIALVGFLPKHALYDYYRMADVCLIPSLSDDMSLSVLDSVAHATPIVATFNTGFPDVEDVGIRVPPKDSEAIADAVIALLSEKKLYTRKRTNARKVVQKYYLSRVAERFKLLYEKLI